MPINMQIEYPKLRDENIIIRQQNKELMEALERLIKWNEVWSKYEHGLAPIIKSAKQVLQNNNTK